MTTTMPVQDLTASIEQSRIRVRLSVDQTDATESSSVQRVPLTIPRAQAYYWGYEWQQGERESRAELDAGHGIVFDSDDPQDIVRWLHEPDGPDSDQD